MKKTSIRLKVLVLSIILVLLTTTAISATYYLLMKNDKHRESRQRIQIAFDIILDDYTTVLTRYRARFEDFVQRNLELCWVIDFYNQDQSKLSDPSYILYTFSKVTDGLKNFGSMTSVDQLALYANDNRLLALYQRADGAETVGAYLMSAEGEDMYLPMDDLSNVSTTFYNQREQTDTSLPPGAETEYTGDIPEEVLTTLFSREGRLGIRIIAPLIRENTRTGTLVGEVFYTQEDIERYARLSKTAVNMFAQQQFSVGTLSVQDALLPGALKQMPACTEILNGVHIIDVSPIHFGEDSYYQGRCGLKNQQQAIGAITVSVSQDLEKQEIANILQAVLLISGLAIIISFLLTAVFSRKAIRSLQNIVQVIGAAAEGDLRTNAEVMTHDEIGMLASRLNQMIAQLREISAQVQEATSSVNTTADSILQEMLSLIEHMEQQSASVDNTTISIEKINGFVDAVARNTTDLLSASGQMLSAIQEMRSSIEEVSTSTTSLTTNLHLISSSVDQVNQSMKHISDYTGNLAGVARQTETEVHHIDQSLQDVSQNAARTQELAKETMDAATQGQESVDASLEGMGELKTVVSDTAQIIQEVNSWGEQVSSILDIVDDIAEQTTLLALNASIISAQAGSHGRGFAVVADEIKDLAVRTKASTKEISTLVHSLQGKTEDGVRNTAKAITKAEQGMQLAQGVKDALSAILERATRSSNRAADTAQVIQQTTVSSQKISTQMNNVTEMVADISTAIREQETDIGQVVAAVENISGMSEQVSRASVEQQRTAKEIERGMEGVTERFSAISEQTEALRHDSTQIVSAMHTIESTTEQLVQNATEISTDTINNLVQQSDVLQKIVNIFKV